MSVRKAAFEDMPDIRRIYAAARQFMRATGNPHQWGNDRPYENLILQDIENSTCHVCEQDGRPYAVFALIPGEDPTYRVIYDGAWLNNAPYAAMHRIASNGTCHGALEEMLEYSSRLGLDLRVDTHRDNRVMQHLLEKNGFTRCGIIHLENGDERIAYQRAGSDPAGAEKDGAGEDRG